MTVCNLITCCRSEARATSQEVLPRVNRPMSLSLRRLRPHGQPPPAATQRPTPLRRRPVLRERPQPHLRHPQPPLPQHPRHRPHLVPAGGRLFLERNRYCRAFHLSLPSVLFRRPVARAPPLPRRARQVGVAGYYRPGAGVVRKPSGQSEWGGRARDKFILATFNYVLTYVRMYIS